MPPPRSVRDRLREFAKAQAWPSQAIRIVCGFTAGGLTDQISRVYGEHLGRRLGQAVIVENKTGGQGSTAAQTVKLAPADGYTLLTTISGTMFTNRVLYKTLPYDADKDFVLISCLPNPPLPFIGTSRPARPTWQGLLRTPAATP